jgi:hypothetical protein
MHVHKLRMNNSKVQAFVICIILLVHTLEFDLCYKLQNIDSWQCGCWHMDDYAWFLMCNCVLLCWFGQLTWKLNIIEEIQFCLQVDDEMLSHCHCSMLNVQVPRTFKGLRSFLTLNWLLISWLNFFFINLFDDLLLFILSFCCLFMYAFVGLLQFVGTWSSKFEPSNACFLPNCLIVCAL